MTGATAERSVADVLRAARERISDPERWLQGSMRDGNRCCALQALIDAQPDSFDEDWLPYRLLGAAMGSDGDVGGFNDLHSHDEVLAAFDRAIELAEAAA